jgi:hypothetical protein
MKTLIVTAWYRVKNKYSSFSVYIEWMNYFFLIKTCPIVVFTDANSVEDLEPFFNQPNVTILIKEMSEFYGYRYMECYKAQEHLMRKVHPKMSSNIKLIWNEKVYFVYELSQNPRYAADWYLWLDIGYFRLNQKLHLAPRLMDNYPNQKKIATLNPSKIYMGNVATEEEFSRVRSLLHNRVLTDNENVFLDHNEVYDISVIAGGAFLVHASMVKYWFNLFYTYLERYFCSNMYFMDDQHIFIDIVLNNMDKFQLVREAFPKIYDQWMVFQTFLL